MALIYQASLTPSKIELIRQWLPSRRWAGAASEPTIVGAYRFDDPAGEVGMEGFVLQSGDEGMLHLPLTYRASPLEGAQDHLVGTTEHSVLGTRWVYDACADPVFAAALASTVLTGAPQAEETVQDEHGQHSTRTPSVRVSGDGRFGAPVEPAGPVACRDEDAVTVMTAPGVELVVVRRIGADVVADHTLTGTWDGGAGVLAGASPRA